MINITNFVNNITKPDKKYYKISARRQDKKINTAKLLQKATEGFEDANAGGHPAASGCHILLKDLQKFKKRLSIYSNQFSP